MTAKTKAALSAEQASLYADNTLGQITALSQRTVTQDIIDSSGTLLDINTFSNPTNTTAPTNGAVIIVGGVGVGGDMRVGGTIYANTYAGPAVLSGTAIAPTQTPGDSSTNIATTAFVTNAVAAVTGGGVPSNSNPLMDGTAAPGVAVTYSRSDHVHPSDTSRAPVASPTFTGVVTIPSGASITGYATLASPTFTGTVIAPTVSPATDNTTKVATTAFVQSAISAVSSGVTLVTAGAGLTGGGTGSVTIAVATNGVTNSLAAQMAANTIKGNNTAGTANAVDMTVAQTMTLLGAAPLASPTFTGTPAAPTATGGTNTTQLATTAFVQSAVSGISAVTSVTAGTGISVSGTTAVTVSMANMAANSLKGNNTGVSAAPVDLTVAQTMTLLGAAPLASPTFTGTVTIPSGASISGFAPLASPTFTGVPASVTPAANDNTTKIATTAYVVGQAGTATPVMDGTAAVGTSLLYARQDHVHASDTSRMAVAGGQTTTGGFRITPYSGGTVSSGTYTPDAYNHNYQYYTNNGAHTLAAPANDSAIDILVTNGATAGAITFSGFTVGANVGDALTTTNTSKFIISIRRINAISTYTIKALQ